MVKPTILTTKQISITSEVKAIIDEAQPREMAHVARSLVPPATCFVRPWVSFLSQQSVGPGSGSSLPLSPSPKCRQLGWKTTIVSIFDPRAIRAKRVMQKVTFPRRRYTVAECVAA
jgi:hypothetical protein